MTEMMPEAKQGSQLSLSAGDNTIGRREAQKQWEANPCGASTVRDVAPETIEWF